MIKRLIYTISYLTILAAIFVVVFYFFSNHSLYFNYISVEPAQDIFIGGERIQMISYMERRAKNTTLEFYDVLRCKESGRLLPQIDQGSYDEKKELSQIKWKFGGTVENAGLPSVTDTYVMESTITYKAFGIIPARQNIISPSFNIVYEN